MPQLKGADVFVLFLLNTQLAPGPHVQGKQPPLRTHSCQLHLVRGLSPGVARHVPFSVCVCPSTAGVRVAAMVTGARAGPTETAMTVTVSLAPRTPPKWPAVGLGEPLCPQQLRPLSLGHSSQNCRTGQGARCMGPCATSRAGGAHAPVPLHCPASVLSYTQRVKALCVQIVLPWL